jgi:phage-related protein
MRVDYYIAPNKENPVSDFLDSLNKKQQAKLLRIVFNIETYGLNSVIPHLKKLTRTPFWEIRVLGKDNLRVIYIVQYQEFVLLLHGFQKKDQKTPPKELEITNKRYQLWKLAN